MGQRILIAGGGTGGHVYPAIATIEALKKRGDFEFLYVGGKDGIETRIVPQYGIAFQAIWVSGFQRYLTWRNLLFPLKLKVSLVQSWQILRKFKPAVAIGTGGYVSGPVLYMAAKMGCPVLIEEQDVYPGVTTRLLAKYARRICLAFEDARRYLGKYEAKTVVTGNPVRKNLLVESRREVFQQYGFKEDAPVILVFGGSQGARSLNEAFLKILPGIAKRFNVQVLWQSGDKNYETLLAEKESIAKGVKILPYIDDMAGAYTAADIIVCRAGAITLAELAIVGKPAVLVPYPHAAGKHQEHNARFIEEQGAAIMITEDEGWEAKLGEALEKLLANSKYREQMAGAWKKLARPQASENIADEVLKLMKVN